MQNIRTISKYYTRVTVTRLSELLDLSPARTETFLSRLVTSKTVYAKIDRPAGLVNFVAPRTGDAVLNDWSADVDKLMGLIEKSCHLIAKVSFFPGELVGSRENGGSRVAVWEVAGGLTDDQLGGVISFRLSQEEAIHAVRVK